MKHMSGLFRFMKITAIAVVNTAAGKCFRRGFYLFSIETFETSQIPLEGTAQITQIVKKGIPGCV